MNALSLHDHPGEINTEMPSEEQRNDFTRFSSRADGEKIVDIYIDFG
jgi:hypothetical protein